MEKLHNDKDDHKRIMEELSDGNSSIISESSDVKPEQNKSKHSKEKKILAGVAITLAVGIGGGMAANFAFSHHPASAVSVSSSENVDDNNSTSETSGSHNTSSMESETSSETPEVLPTVDSLELDGSLASNLNNAGEAFCDEMTNWLNSGATDADVDKDYKIMINNFNGDIDKFSEQQAAKYDALYEQALFKNISSLDDGTANWLKDVTTQHEEVLKNFLSTSGKLKAEGEDLEPYRLKVNFKSAGGLTWMGSSTLQLCSYNSDNSDKNTVGKVESSNISSDENRAIVFEVIDGKIKITKVN